MTPHPYKNLSGMARLRRAWCNSRDGLRLAWRSEAALRQECAALLVLLPLALWLGHDGVERALLAGSAWLVLIVELLNTAIEYAIDRVSLQPHALSKAAKDLGSAAVLLTLALCALVWSLLLVPRVF